MRVLRKKHDRNHIYILADGKCQICGIELGREWHVDHIIPYSIVQCTELDNLQALCPTCNLKKGTLMLRKHQKDLINIIQEKINHIKKYGRDKNSKIADIVADVFPGGGKSTHPIIAFKLLKDAGLVDKLCWVVPRASLQQQGAEGFLDVFFKSLFPHDIEIRETEKSNDVNPSHGSDGYITTYQAISTAYSNNYKRENCHEYDFKKHRYLLFLDECQHATPDRANRKLNKEEINEDGFGFYQAVLPLFKTSHFNIVSSGTLYRHDKTEKVAFVDYETETNYKDDVFYKPKIDLRYTYEDAYKDRAVIPLFTNYGLLDSISYKRGEDKIERKEIKTNIDLSVAIDTEYGKKLLQEGIKHWQNYKKRYNSRSKVIIIGHSQKHCRNICADLKLMGLNPCLAISDEKQDGKNAIIAFRKKRNSDVLVTCQMAYEGLDCKEATHLISLTKIRSIPWLVQMLTRVMRTDIKNDLDWNHQRSFAFVPSDKKMAEALKYVNAKEIPRVAGREELPSINIEAELQGNIEIKQITDATSNLSNMSQHNLEGDNLPPELYPKILLWQTKYNINQAEIDTYKMLRDIGGLAQLDQFSSIDDVVDDDQTECLTIRQKEKNIRYDIEMLTRKLDNKFQAEYGTWNKKSFNAFRYKSRSEMNVNDLLKVKRWLLEEAEREARRINGG